MVMLNGFINADTLCNIIERWLVGELLPGDAAILKQNINFNAVISKLFLMQFTSKAIHRIHNCPIDMELCFNKGQLKNFQIDSYLNKYPQNMRDPRIVKLIGEFRKRPENYFLSTPIDGYIYYKTINGNKEIVASARIKRIKRIAEKAARRIIDYVFQKIKSRADELAESRAREKGIEKNQLISTHEEMIQEFDRAERAIIDYLREGQIIFNNRGFVINDIAGVKIIVDPEIKRRVYKELDENPRTEIIEEEVHQGVYNATNLIVDYKIDKEEILKEIRKRNIKSYFENKGYMKFFNGDFDSLVERFLFDSEDSINVEVILAGMEDTIDSEIGSSMHEERILFQRNRIEYGGILAKNVEALMEFIFLYAISPKEELNELPIKLWVKYMPDYISDIIKDLFGIQSNFI